MLKSPCIGCEFELADKNNATCRECGQRVEYVTATGDMTHSVPVEVTYGQSTILMESIKNINMEAGILEEQKQSKSEEIMENETVKKAVKICVIEGCGKKVAARELCSTHFSAWADGKIEHPTLGKYFRIRPQKPHKKKETIAKNKETPAAKNYPARLDAVTVIDLNEYPRIDKQIDFLAEKYFVTPAHAIIGLLGEALAARARRREHEQD